MILIKNVIHTIDKHGMITEGDAVLAGVSGGADSVALIHVLVELKNRYRLDKLAIAHLNHGLRGRASDEDAEFVEQMARRLGLDHFVEKTDVRQYKKEHGLSLEEAARNVRYAFLSRIAGTCSFNKIALGHHLDDNAEQVMMNLLRGSGPLGISGIPPARDKTFIRPFYNQRKNKIAAYLKKNKIDHRYDTSNEDTRFLRNRIRHELIPLIEKSYNPNISGVLHRSADILREEHQWMDRAIAPFYENSILKKGKNGITLSVDRINNTHLAVKRRIIRKAIAWVSGRLKNITFAHIDDVITFLTLNKASGRLDLPDGICLYRSYDHLVFLRKSGKKGRLFHGDAQPSPYLYRIQEPGREKTIVYIEETGGCLYLSEIDKKHLDWRKCSGPNKVFFDMDVLTFPLKIRTIEPGDRFSPLGVTGSQKIKTYFINRKIPIRRRKKTPVLLDAKSIIWLVGHRMDNCAKITGATTRILCAEFSLRKNQ